MIRYHFIFILLLISFPASLLASETNSFVKSLELLDLEISKRDTYVLQKQTTIDSFKERLFSDNCSEECKYDLFLQLSDQYQLFVYDSAFVYTKLMLESANDLKDKSKEKESKIRLAFIYLSSGLFSDAKELIENIDPQNENEELRLEYYTIAARLFYDMSDFSTDSSFYYKYKEKANIYQDSVIKLQTIPSLCLAAVATRQMKSNNILEAIKNFELLLREENLTDHEIAVAASSLGYLYSLQGNSEKAINALVIASIADIRSVTKETVALRNLASMLFDFNGDYERAYNYIYVAYEDAEFYNAKHRLAEIRSILPIIQKERIKMVENQRNQYIRFVTVLCLLVLVGVIFILIIIKQNRKLLETRNLLVANNNNLQKVNQKLQEANKIKEEYIGYFFRMNSDFIQKQNILRRKIVKLIQSKEYDKLKNIISDEELEELREALFKSFDKIFIKIFPSFVDDFNNLFEEKDKVKLSDSELLNTDLRIYALIRLGIRDNEDIAEFLNYSVNTIYTYKTRIKNKSIIDNENFEKEIMKIKAI